jgi:hypothetical protein
MTSWQGLTWFMFHTMTLNYNPDYREEYVTFFDSLRTIIPCKMCRDNYIGKLNNPVLSIDNNVNPDRIFNWTVDIHNDVNKLNGKRGWSYEEARNYYQRLNFNNKMVKFFLYEYIKTNYRKTPEKTGHLLRMMKTLPYFSPDAEKRQKLIEFKEKFELTRDTFKSWLYAFIVILVS